jgi:exopolyphosphatase/pppGpp-phosphohydrolase
MKPVGIVKIGSSNTGLLIAASLSQPILRLNHLVDLKTPANWLEFSDVLATYRLRCRESQVACGIVAGGEVLRRHYELRQLVWDQGWPLWEVSGKLEGQLTWFAVRSRDPAADVVIDVGGGSTEIIHQSAVTSIPIGAANVTGEIDWPQMPEGERAALVGGTAYVLSRLAETENMGPEQLAAAIDQVLEGSSSPVWRSLEAHRQQLVIGGSIILKSLLNNFRFSQFSVSPWGYTEGLWMAASLGRARPLW